MSKPPLLLSPIQVRPILEAKQRGASRAIASLDLGLTEVEMALEAHGLRLPDKQLVPWSIIEEIPGRETACFAFEDGQAFRVQRFSELTNRVYSLMPTCAAPTLLVSGIPMHRIKDTDPTKDTLQKIRAVAPLHGWVLDTATGLGYTAIEAVKTADKVVTVELDPAVLEICRVNPWSQALFGNPGIEQIIGDVFDLVAAFPHASFNHIIHDPPTLSLAGDLYSGDFYRQTLRVLKRSGRLFHYVGDPTSKSGRNVTRSVVRRLKEAGYRRVSAAPSAFGVVAYK